MPDFDVMHGLANTGNNQVQWRVEVDTNGYKACGFDVRGERGVSNDKQSTDRISNNGSSLKSRFDRDNPPDIEFTINGCGLLFPMQFMPTDTQSHGIKCTFAIYGEEE